MKMQQSVTKLTGGSLAAPHSYSLFLVDPRRACDQTSKQASEESETREKITSI
jgi:hypothetical protein